MFHVSSIFTGSKQHWHFQRVRDRTNFFQDEFWPLSVLQIIQRRVQSTAGMHFSHTEMPSRIGRAENRITTNSLRTSEKYSPQTFMREEHWFDLRRACWENNILIYYYSDILSVNRFVDFPYEKKLSLRCSWWSNIDIIKKRNFLAVNLFKIHAYPWIEAIQTE